MYKPWYSFLFVTSPISKILWGIVSLLITVLALGFQFAVEEPRMKAQTENWAGRSIEKGAEIWANNCSNCHGTYGQGSPGPALNTEYFFTQRLNDLQYSGSLKSFVALTVAAGRPNRVGNQWGVMMPTWGQRYGGPLRDDQVEHIVTFVMNWQRTAISSTNLSEGFVEGPYPYEWLPFLDGSDPAHPVSTSAAVSGTVASGPRTPQVLYGPATAGGMNCNACHNIKEAQTPDTLGQPAPNHGNLHETAASAVPGMSAEEYIYQSIVEPNAHIVSGYSADIMPKDFPTKMSEEEIRSLVAWILDPNRPQ